MSIDEECRCLLRKLDNCPGSWDGSIIYHLKERLQVHYYKSATYGPHYQSDLSTSTLFRILDVLVCADFDDGRQRTDLAVELHLRCIVATLQILKIHGASNCSNFLTFDFLDKIYDSMSKWWEYHHRQSLETHRIGPKHSLENYNNEFLIVYATDLISAVSADRDLTTHAVTHVAAGVALMGRLNAEKSISLPRSFKAVVHRKHTPSTWHEDYRSMDNILLYLRLLQERIGGDEPQGVQEAIADLVVFAEGATHSFFGAVSQLIKADMDELKATTETLEPLPIGLHEAPATARVGHFTYALLDLLQQNIKLLYREERLKILVDIALHVAKNSPRSFLRCKAFEVLISVGKMEGVGIHKVEREVEQTLRAETSRWTGSLRKIPDQWRGMKTKAGEMDMFRAQISSITVDSPSLSLEAEAQRPPGPLDSTARMLNTLVKSLEELLVSSNEDEHSELFQLSPCGHCRSRLSWMNSEDRLQNLCSVCKANFEGCATLPSGSIGQVLRDMKQELKELEGITLNRNVHITTVLKRKESLIRPPSPVPSTLREKITDIPARLLGKPGSIRRSSLTDDLKSLAESVDPSEFRVRNGIKLLGAANYSYQTTAISSSGAKIVLVSRADFCVYEISATLESKFLCWGDINKRYAHQQKQSIEAKSAASYHKCATTDEVLAIASVKNFVDIRNARSGQRIRQLTVQPSDTECRAIAFSPDGQSLGIGLESGDILVYEAGLRLDFGARPIRVTSAEHNPVASIAFSQDSLLMAACTADSIVRIYRLSNLSDGCLEQFVKPSVHGKRSESVHITDLDLYIPPTNSNRSLPDSSLFIVSQQKKALPFILTSIASTQGNQPTRFLKSSKLEQEHHRVACYPKSRMLAAIIITSSGEFVLTYLSPTDTNVWLVCHHPERLDLTKDKTAGFCSVSFSETRALALDRRGNLLVMDLTWT